LQISQDPLQEDELLRTVEGMTKHDQQERPDWNEIYRERDQLWSGKVNGSLVAEVQDLPVGRALDVGCGEGADALWLAENGWTVTAADVAETAIERAQTEAARQGASITWLATDILTDPPSTAGFDLVTLHYPAFDIAQRSETVAALTGAVAPGGLLLAVGHAPPEDPDSIPFDPADWVQPADIAADLGEGWTIETHETRPRPGDHHHGSPHTHDVVVRARRSN
jgi:SAM-dependent methyltransferase